MGKYIDVHNHVAWEIDDGMPRKEDAILTIQTAVADGITKIIATPHFIPGQQMEEDVMKIYSRIQELKELARQFDLQVYQGGELFLNSGYLDMIDNNLCPTLASSRYLLCEFDVRKDIRYDQEADEKLYEIKVRKLVPVIAHVERYFHKIIDLNRIQNWIKEGYKIQINRTSLLGMHGQVCKENALKLIERGYVHIIASDAHRATGSRIMKLSDAYAYVVNNFGREQAEILCKRNPQHILLNEDLENCPKGKRRLWNRIFKRS